MKTAADWRVPPASERGIYSAAVPQTILLRNKFRAPFMHGACCCTGGNLRPGKCPLVIVDCHWPFDALGVCHDDTVNARPLVSAHVGLLAAGVGRCHSLSADLVGFPAVSIALQPGGGLSGFD